MRVALQQKPSTLLCKAPAFPLLPNTGKLGLYAKKKPPTFVDGFPCSGDWINSLALLGRWALGGGLTTKAIHLALQGAGLSLTPKHKQAWFVRKEKATNFR